MEAFATLLVLVTLVAVGYTFKRWLGGRLSPLKDHSKKLDQVRPDGVDVAAPKPVHERRLKLALPDLSSIQIHSPVGPMKSSVRSALKELRSRQMVQSLCSKFESRLKVANEEEHDIAQKPLLESPQTLLPAASRRREVTAVPQPLAVPVSSLASENTVTTAARSNNLKKFLRSYASNLDVAISAERSVIMVAESDDSSGDEIVLTLPMAMTKTKAQTVVANPNRGMKFELDLPMLQLESERSNQCDSSPTADDASDVADLVEGTDYEQQSVDNGDDEEGNNDDNNDSRIITSARTNKQAGPETTAQDQDSKPERSAPASKLNLARFQQQVPANGKRLHALRL